MPINAPEAPPAEAPVETPSTAPAPPGPSIEAPTKSPAAPVEVPAAPAAKSYGLRSLRMVAARRSGRRVAAILIGLVLLTVAVLAFVPWQQTVVGSGQVIVYSAMHRPQNVEAMIPGRLAEWRVQEGVVVKQGDVIARLEDIDAKFLDPEQPRRLERQKLALQEQRARAETRVARLGSQVASLTQSRDAAIKTAGQRVAQARQLLRSSEQAVVASRKNAQIALDVARRSAGERANQARLRVQQAEQALTATQQEQETARLQRDRIKALYDEGLRSRRDNELAQNDFVKGRTDVERAELALSVARRDANIGVLDKNRTDLEVERARAEIEQAEAARAVAARDVLAAQLDLNKITADTAASLDAIGASRESARENTAKIDSDLQKLDVERANLAQRTNQQVIKAPSAGRVVRLLQVGAGATVKAGDVLAVLAPATADRAVEIMVTDNDVALLSEGRRVRLQIAGWPALQFSGWPSVAVGTFAGRVAVIDAVDDGLARYRVIVKPDTERIASGKEQDWPSAELLRPGAEATGWILLDKVSLGYELWRQFNAFPPTVKRPIKSKKEGDDPKYDEKDEKTEKKQSPFIKVKQPK